MESVEWSNSCVAYRGYFDESGAITLSQRLARRGDDTAVAGVATYSTLGLLPDPVFNTMLAWAETRFVGTIFHELAHERLYVAGDSEFSEAFASVVEQEGLRLWLLERGDTAALERYRAVRAREAEFAALLRSARQRLEQLYESRAPVETLRIEKQREFGRLKFEYAQLRARWGGQGGYDAWFARTLNNAHLAAVATYHDCVPELQRELEALEEYCAAVKAQSRKKIVVTDQDLRSAFKGLVLPETAFERIGPAVNSGTSIFLYGPPGNGKTTIARAIGNMTLGESIYIPHALYINGLVVKLFDSVNHQVVTDEAEANLASTQSRATARRDMRWVHIRRPFIMTGGELTLTGLDLVFDDVNKYYEAPIQVKANCGILLIDDFGRQLVAQQQNRKFWMIGGISLLVIILLAGTWLAASGNVPVLLGLATVPPAPTQDQNQPSAIGMLMKLIP